MNENELYHKGKKGTRWGYTNGKKNGKRTKAITDNTHIGKPKGIPLKEYEKKVAKRGITNRTYIGKPKGGISAKAFVKKLEKREARTAKIKSLPKKTISRGKKFISGLFK